MSTDQRSIRAVPTNIITGFLGVGKTSAILNLLRNKSTHERWAVLVNEFGEIGVDGSLLQGQRSEEQGVFIREVPGGCMCCAAGLPMQIALNQLLTRSKPDRLLIEPTGLGHPKEVVQVLSADYYQDVLSLQKTLTLVDARKLACPRYTQHETFQQQVAVADTVIGNKLDLYNDGDKQALLAYVKEQGQAGVAVLFSEHGKFEISALQGASSALLVAPHHHHDTPARPLMADVPLPECGFVKAVNDGEGFRSVGWRFSPDKVFDRNKLFSFLTGLQVERMKAVFITHDGVFGYNLTADALTESELDDCLESRIEIITDHLIDNLSDKLEQQLLACEA